MIPAAFLLWWYITTQSDQTFLPSPAEVWIVFVRFLRNGKLAANISISAARAFGGFLIGGGIGFALGLACGLSPTAEKLLNTPVQMVRNIPFLAMMPLILIWFGIGEAAKVTLVALGVFFPIYLDTYHGIRFVDQQLLEMGRAYGMGPWKLFWNIVFPGALPSVLVGVRQGLGRMWTTLIVAETVAANSGLGFMVTNAREYMQLNIIVMGIVIYALLGILSDAAANTVEHFMLNWRRKEA